MAETVGVSLKQFAESIVISYRKAIEDSIKHLQYDLDTMDIKAMEDRVIKDLEKQGKVKADW